MGERDLAASLTAHGISAVRLLACNHDGLVLGKYLSVPKFLSVAERGTMLADTTFGVDFSGDVALGWDWGSWRGEVADIRAVPDLGTLTPDPALPGLASVICDFVGLDSEPLPICPRGMLKRMVAGLDGHRLSAVVAPEIEFSVFEESIQSARAQGYRDLTPLGGPSRITYLISRSPDLTAFMDAVVRRLDDLGVEWESWSSETAAGQVEINLAPTDPLTAADGITRTKLAVREIAGKLERSATFMGLVDEHLGASMHVNLSLRRGSENAFEAPAGGGDGAVLMRRWIAGLLATMPGAMSFFSPTVNSYRRLVEIAGPPTTVTWGESNKSTALRVVIHDPASTRIEHRVPAMDCNPYLALAAILAGGLIGMDDALEAPEPFEDMAWGLLGDAAPRLPASITAAAEALAADGRLRETLGAEGVDYWLGSRRWEWLAFHRNGGDPDAVTPFELSRYFEQV